MYTRSRTVPDLWPSLARFAWRSASSFPEMPVCPGTQWISVSMPALRRVLPHWLIHLARCCAGPGSRCSVCRMAACESLKTATFVTQCDCSVSCFFTDSRSASPIAHSSASKTSIPPVPRWLRKALQPSLWLHTAAAPTLPSSDRDPSSLYGVCVHFNM